MIKIIFRKIGECFQVLRILSFFILMSLGFSSYAVDTHKKPNAAIVERKAFIELANKQTWEQANTAGDEMGKRGYQPMMRVTTLKPFGDWDFYYVNGGSIVWSPNTGQKYTEVVVPDGFVTDLTSIPRVFWQVLRPEGRYAYAAVVHDYLYWKQSRTRIEADEILKLAMEDSKVDPKIVNTIYTLVRKFGQSAWNNNAKLKKAGEHRFLKDSPQDFTTSWNDWKKNPDVFADEN